MPLIETTPAMADLLNTCSYATDLVEATTAVESRTFRWDADDATTSVQFSRTIGFTVDNKVSSFTFWTLLGVPTITAAVSSNTNTATLNKGALNTVTITGNFEDEALVDYVSADLKVFFAVVPHSTNTGANAFKRRYVEGTIVSVNATTIVCTVMLPLNPPSMRIDAGPCEMYIQVSRKKISSKPFVGFTVV